MRICSGLHDVINYDMQWNYTICIALIPMMILVKVEVVVAAVASYVVVAIITIKTTQRQQHH